MRQDEFIRRVAGAHGITHSEEHACPGAESRKLRSPVAGSHPRSMTMRSGMRS